MVAPLKWTSETRDRIHNLDLNNAEHYAIYDGNLKDFIMANELLPDKGNPGKLKFNNESYLDNANPPKVTVGVGFNMDDPSARPAWRRVFGDEVSFDDVYNKKTTLTDAQVSRLFDDSIELRRNELKRFFGPDWNKLKANERAATESMYYSCPRLVIGSEGRDTNYSRNIKQYVSTSNPQSLDDACDEVKYRSNKPDDTGARNKGLQNRRDAEAEMLKSDDCPMRSLPAEDPIPFGKTMNVAIGKTVVPYKTPGTECITSREYYIWRTMQDGKVRKSHRDYDGKIFNVNNPPIAGYPGDDYNCRCYADFEIPHYIEIEDTDRVIRKYIVDLNLLPNFCVK